MCRHGVQAEKGVQRCELQGEDAPEHSQPRPDDQESLSDFPDGSVASMVSVIGPSGSII